jgi:hypothetical protein
MSADDVAPMALESPRGVLLGAKGWAGVMAAAVTLLVLVPVLNLMVPAGQRLPSERLPTSACWARSCATRSARWRWT